MVADVTSEQGLRLAAAALQHRSTAGRVGLLLNSAAAAAGRPLAPVEQLLAAVGSGQWEPDLMDLCDGLDALLQSADGRAPGALTLQRLDKLAQAEGQLAPILSGLSTRLPAAAAAQTRFARGALGLGAGVSAVVTNGRLVELPLPVAAATTEAAETASAEAASLEPSDFELLEVLASRDQYSARAAALVRDAQTAGGALSKSADPSAVVAAISSALAAARPEDLSPTSGRILDLLEKSSSLKNALSLPRRGAAADCDADADAGPPPPIVLHAVLNPLSATTQRLAPLLRFLTELLGAEVGLWLNPRVRCFGGGLALDGMIPCPALPAFARLLFPTCLSAHHSLSHPCNAARGH